MKFDTMIKLDIYPVGLLSDLKQFRARWRHSGIKKALQHFCLFFPSSFLQKNYYNGYLAEPEEMPAGVRRCGSGWTKGRARRSWLRQLRKAGYEA